ncbi:sigma-70 family RNA polymerase sigma factor [Acidovorax cavernicola]|uniref:Sigma-70 family RNA polymerase sigma factor n=1 Tax=Acidovorax cavernicola TaxID=1675792 RepID=A0A9X8GUQ3_9BURK|nr:sigma-70 family RNA polymerase sigma factor [Acidovorax cavernicola]
MSASAPSNPGSPHPVHVLYVEHRDWLQRWLWRRLGCANQAADLSHDTFVRVLVSDTREEIREPRAFLTTLAQRVLASFWRRRSLEQAWLEALAHEPPDLVPSAEDHALVREAVERFDRMLDGLPRRSKQIFLMNRLEGHTHAAIAAQLGLSVATIERHVRQAYIHCMAADLSLDREDRVW